MTYKQLKDKKVYLCGRTKIVNDLAAFFRELNIIKIEDIALYQPDSDSCLVVCEFDISELHIDMVYAKDYIFAVDLIKLVNYTESFYCSVVHPNKKIIVFGTGFNAHKLMLRNPDLDVDYYVDNDVKKHGDVFYGKKVFSVDKLESEADLVVIVTPKVDISIKRQLQDIGLEFGKDFYFYDADRYPFYPIESLENTFAYYLARNNYSYFNKCKVCIVGCGNEALYLTNMENLPIQIENYAVLDNKNKTFQGKEVLDLRQTDAKSVYLVTDFDEDIIEFLQKKGLIENQDYFISKSISNYSYAEMLLLTITDEHHINNNCDYTYRGIIVNYDGDFAACSLMCKAHFGNLYNNSIAYLMKSIGARIAWLSCVNGTYSFCYLICSHMKSGAISRQMQNIPKKYPEICTRLNVSYDPACNLTCPSCRDKVISRPFEPEKVKMLHDEVKKYLPNVQRLVDSYGECFISKYMLELYFNESINGDTAYILCNGLLFNKNNFEKLKDKYQKVNAYFSIDAATSETYSKLRRGGNFETIKQNLAYCKSLRESGLLNYLSIVFVVQKDNFREMPDFVKMGLDNSCDKVLFKVLTNRVGWTADEFIENDVYNIDSKYHSEFVKMIKNPVFHDVHVHLPIYNHNLTEKDYFIS